MLSAAEKHKKIWIYMLDSFYTLKILDYVHHMKVQHTLLGKGIEQKVCTEENI